MRARLDEVVTHYLEKGMAVPALTAYNFSTAAAVVSAAEDRGRAAILLVAPNTAVDPDGMRLIRALRGLADSASVPVSIQLDHAKSLPLITAAVGAGVDAVLADGSHLALADNIAFVRAVADECAGAGIVVEAELGAIGGDEDRADAAPARSAGGLVDPDIARTFVERTGARLLAPSVGNVHGTYRGEPTLHWDLIENLRASLSVPLVMHGASGLPVADIQRAIRCGFGKVNINTELRAVVLAELERVVPDARRAGLDVLAVERNHRETVWQFTQSAFTTLDARAQKDTE